MSEELPAESKGQIIVFGAKSIRRAWVDDQWYFSVIDIVGALTDSASPPKYWDAMKRREQESSGVDLSTFCRKVKLTGADGKLYASEAVNTESAGFPCEKNSREKGKRGGKKKKREARARQGEALRRISPY